MKQCFGLVLLLCSIVLIDMQAQNPVDFDLFQFRTVGPNRGGRATAVAGVHSQPNVFYLGSTGGGLWKSKDYGTTWNNISDGFFESPSIGAIAVAENDPNVLYVGTGSDGLRSNVITGKGIYKSMDAGETWQHVGLKNVGQIGAVEIHPNDHNTVFVAAIGQAFQPNEERGIYKTTDGGETWEKVLYISDKTGFADLEFMPSNPNIVYAAAWRAERKPWTIISGGEENGIYKSVDGGKKWSRQSKGLPELMGKIDLGVSAADSKLLYALVEAEGEQTGLYVSSDQGKKFKQVSKEEDLLHRAFYFTNLEIDPNDAQVVYVLGKRFFKSKNGGEDWDKLSAPHVDQHDLWINKNNSDLMIESNDGGANVTHNGGKSWSTQFNQSTAEIYQVEVDNQYPYWLYGGQQDNYTTIAIPSLPPHSQQAGSIGYILDTGGCETGPAVPNPDNPDIVYSNCKGRFSVYNKKTGQEQQYNVGAAFMYGHNPANLRYRFQRVTPIHLSPHDSQVIYHCSQYVHRTTDEGRTWETISPDLTAFEKDKQVFSGEPITRDITGEEFYSTIYSIRESILEKGLIWVGANDGPIHLSQDDGQNWKEVTPGTLPRGGRVDCVEPSPHQASKAFICILRYQLGDWKPYIYRTKDYGKSWKLVTKGISQDHPVRVLREDPEQESLLYAGTEFGLYISFDDGDNWQAFQQNLPVTPVTDIKVHRNDLVLSTMGRGFYILDNVSTLHQGFLDIDTSTAHLFKPEETIRYRYYPEEPYPPSSVIIDYYLPDTLEQGIQLQILNEQGKVLQAFSSDSLSKESSGSRDMSTNNFEYKINPALPNKKGVHRFHWDMRHQGPWDEEEEDRFTWGPMVATGEYQVKLLYGDQEYKQKFSLKADPRVLESGTTDADIKAQEQLALQIVELLSSAKKRAFEIKQEMDSTEDEFELSKLKSLYDDLVRADGRYPETKFISQVDYLLGMLMYGDQRPGRDAYERFEELKDWFEAKFE